MSKNAERKYSEIMYLMAIEGMSFVDAAIEADLTQVEAVELLGYHHDNLDVFTFLNLRRDFDAERAA